MARAIKITPDNTVTEVDIELKYPALNKNFGEDVLVQRVQLPRLPENPDGSRNILIIDEESRLKGLPYNELATRLYVDTLQSDYTFITGDAYLISEFPHREDWDALTDTMTVETLQAMLEGLKGR